MRLFLLGATGRIGGHALDLALAAGHEVTAFVRSPRKLAPRPRLTVVAGDPFDAAALAAALPGHDAVLSALGPPPREALRPSTMMADVARSTLAAMQTAGVSRLVLVSAAVLFPGRGLAFAFFRWLLRHHARDLVAMESGVRASPAAWTLVRPPRLVSSPETDHRIAVDALPEGGSVVSFRAVAARMLACAERGEHVGQVVGMAR